MPPGAERSQIAELGKPFDLNVIVENDTTDLFAVELEFAVFVVASARLSVEGQLVPYIGNGSIDFTDDWSGMFDLVTFSGEFEISGLTTEIGSLVALPTSTFHFGSVVEPPPVFGLAENAADASCCGNDYTTFVPAGNLIMAVPEPEAGLSIGYLVLAALLQGPLRRYRISHFAAADCFS